MPVVCQGFLSASNNELTLPPKRTVAITISDTEELPYFSRTIRANVAGTITVINADGTTLAAKFAAGETRVMAVRQIKAAGTTVNGAGDIEVGF